MNKPQTDKQNQNPGDSSDELPPITIKWEEVEAMWEGCHDANGTMNLAKVDLALENRFFEERLVLTEDNILYVRFRHDYPIAMKRIETPLHLVAWSIHLLGKTWMNGRFIREFMKKVCAIKGWNAHSTP